MDLILIEEDEIDDELMDEQDPDNYEPDYNDPEIYNYYSDDSKEEYNPDYTFLDGTPLDLMDTQLSDSEEEDDNNFFTSEETQTLLFTQKS